MSYRLTSVLSKRDRRLLLETKRLLEEILETEVLADKRLMIPLKKSDEDVEAGRVLTLDEVNDELG